MMPRPILPLPTCGVPNGVYHGRVIAGFPRFSKQIRALSYPDNSVVGPMRGRLNGPGLVYSCKEPMSAVPAGCKVPESDSHEAKATAEYGGWDTPTGKGRR